MNAFSDIKEQYGLTRSAWVRQDIWKKMISGREVKLEEGEKKRNWSGHVAAEAERHFPLSFASRHLPKDSTPSLK
jgi:hypothetical protein